MKYLALAAVAALASVSATSANAATTITASGQVTLDPTDTVNIPFSWTVVANATAGTNLAGVQSTIVYTFTAVDASKKVFDLSYSLTNTSSGAGALSSIAVFGFDVSGSPDLQVVTGPFIEGSGGNFSGLGQRDFCLYEGSNCNGGGSAGVYVGNAAATGTFRLTYATAQSSIVLENFATRWQRTGTQANGSAAGFGTPTAPVPEPATWAMMIAGFGLVGGAMRRRVQVKFQAA